MEMGKFEIEENQSPGFHPNKWNIIMKISTIHFHVMQFVGRFYQSLFRARPSLFLCLFLCHPSPISLARMATPLSKHFNFANSLLNITYHTFNDTYKYFDIAAPISHITKTIV